MAGKKDTLLVYDPLQDWSRKSKLILKKREDGRVVGNRLFILDEAKGWEASERFKSIGGEAILNEAINRTNQAAITDRTDDHLKMLEWAMVLEKHTQVDKEEVHWVDSEEAMECFLNLASQEFMIQEVDDKKL